MSWLYSLAFGFLMNFLVGFFLKGIVFREFKPLPRAALTALASWFFCVGIAGFFAYYLLGTGIAALTASSILIAYIIPAFIHFLVLYYQMNMAWSYTDAEEAEDLAALEAKDRSQRENARIVNPEE